MFPCTEVGTYDITSEVEKTWKLRDGSFALKVCKILLRQPAVLYIPAEGRKLFIVRFLSTKHLGGLPSWLTPFVPLIP